MRLNSTDKKKAELLKTAFVDIAYLMPTATALRKSVLDATESVRSFLRITRIHDYTKQNQGQEHKVVLPAFFITEHDVVRTRVTLYRPKTKKGDSRLWFYGLNNYARAGDKLAIIAYNGSIHVINMTQIPTTELSPPTSKGPLGKIISILYHPPIINEEVHDMGNEFDITPSPRVLRMLGQIDFKPWQCLAELIDNSIDAFIEGRKTTMILQPEVQVNFPSQAQLKAGTGTIQVLDNGIGMTPETLQESVRAGYSGNDPVEKLGLFGMGFNIATARLGHRTEVWTITKDAPEWTGIIIDFDELEKGRRFIAPRLTRPRSGDEGMVHGTEIIVKKLDEERVRPLIIGRGRNALFKKLGKIYGRLISNINLDIKIDGEQVNPTLHCVWDKLRKVETAIGPVAVIQAIHEELEPRPYCTTCWIWLERDEEVCPACGLSSSVGTRPRVIHGWIGIQRFFDRWHYGIDLIRNGRVIEELDQSFFSWENPQTDDIDLEYPIDTMYWGGRIVGELDIDFVRISHQKDSFDKRDPQWEYVVKAVRGDGPLRPNIARDWGYEANTSPLGRLFLGYRTARQCGIKYLVPGDTAGQGINAECHRWADLFWAGEPDYQTDEKWYEAVLMAEEAQKKAHAKAKAKTDETAGKPPFETEEGTEEASAQGETSEGVIPVLVDDTSLSRIYELKEMNGSPVLKVKARRLTEGQLETNQPIRFSIHKNEATFDYNPTHEYFETSLDTPAQCLARELSYQLLARSNENQINWPMTKVDQELRSRYFIDTLTDVDTLGRQASAFLDELREFLLEELPTIAPIQISVLNEHDLNQIRTRLIAEGKAGEEKVSNVISSGNFPRYLGIDFLPRAISIWPELVLDGGFLSVTYATVAKELQPIAVEQVVGALRDVVWLCEQASLPGLNRQQWRAQLSRTASSLHLLMLWRS